MATIRVYHRPTTLEAALDLLANPDAEAIPLGGGTELNGLPGQTPEEVVDLQALGLSNISGDGATLEVGAMATLRDLMDYERAPRLLRDLARREAPNTIRNAATLGGTVATADPASGLVAGLLAYSASVVIARATGSDEIPLSDLVDDGGSLAGGIITSVRVAVGGDGAFEATSRTPVDTPIVLVAGHRTDDGVLRLAATGVASRPVVIDPESIQDLDPPPDFRGSVEYRRHLARVLTARVVGHLAGGNRK